MNGATYDTGMLIALDRKKSRALAVHERLFERHIRVTVPWVVLAHRRRWRTSHDEFVSSACRS